MMTVQCSRYYSKERPVPQAYSPALSLMAVERPLCPDCQSRMVLSQVEIGARGSELLTFECLQCDRQPKSPFKMARD